MTTGTPPSLKQRCAGILLHPTSLPGRHGCGGFGREARRFVDFLVAAGQRWWQVLPLGPIGDGHAPYNGTSAFAGNPMLIDLDELIGDGLLTRSEATPRAGFSATRVRYPAVLRARRRVLRLAFDRFRKRHHSGVDRFARAERYWLSEYCLFSALKAEIPGTPWTDWPRGVARRDPHALRAARRRLHDVIAFERFIQRTFDAQWSAIRRYAHERGVGIIGDLPFFVSHDSCDVWTHQTLFQLDARGKPARISGVPPDYFCPTGQLWGHPLYCWPAHRAERFRWWVERVRRAHDQFDAVRVDHFLGLHRCWSVAGDAETAEHGRWVRSPGVELLDTLNRRLGTALLVAEDLGAVTPEAERLRADFDIPGLRVLQFGFGDGGRYHEPHNYPRDCVAYTGTHDNETIVGWLRGHAGRHGRDTALRYARSDGRQAHWDMIRLLYMSRANTVIVPLQDVLGLGNHARMNRPGTTRGNWTWRVRREELTRKLAGTLRAMVDTYERQGASA